MSRIAIELTAHQQQQIRVKAAYLQQDLQTYLTSLIERDVADVVIPPKYALPTSNGNGTHGRAKAMVTDVSA